MVRICTLTGLPSTVIFSLLNRSAISRIQPSVPDFAAFSGEDQISA